MKNLLTLLLFSFIGVASYAQSIVVVSGNVHCLHKERKIRFEFTYDDMLVGKMTEAEYVKKKMTDYNDKEAGKGDAWVKSWLADRKERFEPKFIELFIKYMEENETPFQVDDTANYILKINTVFTEPGFNVGVMRRNASVDLVCKLINAATGKQEALINVRDASANNFMGTDFDSAFRLQESYAKAGRELAQFLIKKAKIKS